MAGLGAQGRSWLKGFHLLFSCTWLGAALSMLLVTWVFRSPGDGSVLFGANAAVKLIDDFIIIPSALGCLLTGLLFSLLTNWGFFRHRWLTFKWIATLWAILFGTFFLGPWVNGMTAIAEGSRLAALQDPEYLRMRGLNLGFGLGQFLLLAFTVFLSTIRPWSRKGRGPRREK